MDHIPDIGKIGTDQEEYTLEPEFKEILIQLISSIIKNELYTLKESMGVIQQLMKKNHVILSELVQQANDNTITIVNLSRKVAALDEMPDKHEEQIRILIEENNSLRDMLSMILHNRT